MSFELVVHQATANTYQNTTCLQVDQGAKPSVSVGTRTEEISSFFKHPASPPAAVIESTQPGYSAPGGNPSSAPIGASAATSAPTSETQIFTAMPTSPGEVVVEAVRISGKARVHLPQSNLPEAPRRRGAEKIRNRDLAISQAVHSQKISLLKKLLDGHPHAGPDPADRSLGTLISKFFRQIVSLFDSNAAAWQRKEAVQLLAEAARVGNVEVINMLLDRCMDLRKDLPMIAPALLEAVKSDKPKATELLLKKVVEINPRYSPDETLTAIAARRQRADVLEILVRNGMALPARAERWSRYGEAIEDYLRWSASQKQLAAPQSTLSCAARDELNSRSAKLELQFCWKLNQMRCSLRSAQKLCLYAEMFAGSGLPTVNPETYVAAGFTFQTAATLARELNTNAGHHASQVRHAPAMLAAALNDEFMKFTRGGDIRPALLTYLMDKGMYGILADLVVTAFESASKQSMSLNADRGMLLADALEQCAGKATANVHAAAHASGHPALFHKLLSPQLQLLLDYCDAQCKRAASTTSGQPMPAAGAD